MIIGIGIPSNHNKIPLPINKLLTATGTKSQLFLADDFANGVLDMADRTLNSAFRLVSFAFSFRLGVAKSLAGLLLDFAGDFFHPSCNAIFVHDQFLCVVSHVENTAIRRVVPGRRAKQAKLLEVENENAPE